jgi:hypothetical protein
MEMNRAQLIERMRIFSEKTLEWCANESEQSTARVTNAIALLLQNTERVSRISAASLAAIDGVQRAINLRLGEQNRESIGKLIKSLQQLVKQHREIEGVIQPIIHALQFQDRLRQNLENMMRMLPLWLAFREGLPDQITEQRFAEFGKQLTEVTTMKAERDIIRQHIHGLEPEVDIAAMTLF